MKTKNQTRISIGSPVNRGRHEHQCRRIYRPSAEIGGEVCPLAAGRIWAGFGG
jgi:hypothetical protein